MEKINRIIVLIDFSEHTDNLFTSVPFKNLFFLVFFTVSIKANAQLAIGTYVLPNNFSNTSDSSFDWIGINPDSSFVGYWCFESKNDVKQMVFISGKYSIQILGNNEVLVTFTEVNTKFFNTLKAVYANNSLCFIDIPPPNVLYLDEPNLKHKKFSLTEIDSKAFGMNKETLLHRYRFYVDSNYVIVNGLCGCGTFSAQINTLESKLSFTNIAVNYNKCLPHELKACKAFIKILKQTRFYDFKHQEDLPLLKLYNTRQKPIAIFNYSTF